MKKDENKYLQPLAAPSPVMSVAEIPFRLELSSKLCFYLPLIGAPSCKTQFEALKWAVCRAADEKAVAGLVVGFPLKGLWDL